MNQLSLIFDVLGAPPPEEVAHIRGAQARKFLDKLDGKAAVPFTEVLPGIPADAASLLKSLLLLDPVKRFTPREALSHPFFDQLRCVRAGGRGVQIVCGSVGLFSLVAVIFFSFFCRWACIFLSVDIPLIPQG